MSSILKALRKLEDEKARRQPGVPDIARDILSGSIRRSRVSAWMVPCGLFLLTMIFGLLGYLVVETGKGGEGVLRSTIAETAVRQDRSAPETASVPSFSAAAPEESSPSASASPVSFAEMPPQKSAPAPVRSSIAPSAANEEKSVVPPVPLPAKSPPRSPRHDFELSGIAFQEEPEARMAIVNGLPVMTGTMIGGARVEEILSDRIRLSVQGRRVEIRLAEAR